MNWNEQFRAETSRQRRGRGARSGPIPVDGISGIPIDAIPKDIFSLTVEVVEIIEKTTKTDDPYYFVHCRDSEGIKFCVVCWSHQWVRFRGAITEGASIALAVSVPKSGYSAYSLA